MPTDLGLQALLCGGASVLLTLAACSTQAQVAEQTNESTETIVVTQPTKSRAFTRVVKRESPPEGEEQTVRIERKNINGDEQIELWLNGKKVDVKDKEGLREALGDLDIRFFDESDLDADGDGPRIFRMDGPRAMTFQAQPRRFRIEGMGEGDDPFTVVMPNVDLNWTTPKAMLGVQLAPISSDLRDYLGLEGDAGVRVDSVVDDSPAAKAGLKAKDIIVAAKIGSENLESITVDELRQAIAKSDPDTKVTLTVLRQGDKKKITATLTKWEGEQFGLAGGGEHQIELISPEFFNGRGLQLENIPELKEQFRMIEPQLRELQIDRNGMLKERNLPNMEELMQRMDEQMRKVEEMLKNLQEQQKQLRQQVQKSPEPEA